MTPTPPQKEYVITEEQLRDIELCLINNTMRTNPNQIPTKKIVKTIRSRPAPSPQYTDKLVPPGTIISVDEDCNITRHDGSINPCCHRPAMTFIDCYVGYLPHGECPKWNYNHRGESQKFIAEVAAIRNATLDEIDKKIIEQIDCHDCRLVLIQFMNELRTPKEQP